MWRSKRPLRRPRTRRLICEGLEDRTVLSGGLLAVPLNLVAVAPLQAPTADAATPALAKTGPLTSLLDSPVVQDVQGLASPLALKVNPKIDVSLPGVLHIDLAPTLSIGGNQGPLVQTSLNVGIAVLGVNALSINTGASLGSGSGLVVTANTTVAGGSTTGVVLQTGGQGGSLTPGGSPAGSDVGTPDSGGHAAQVPVAGGTGSRFIPAVPVLANVAGSPAVVPLVAAGSVRTSAPVAANVGSTTGGPTLLGGGTEEMTAADFLPAIAAAVPEATAAPALLDGGAVDSLFLQGDLLFGAGNDTDLGNAVVAPELPAVPADTAVPTAQPVVSQGELYDGGTSLLPEGDGLVQNCMPFDVQSLDDALRNLAQQFQLLSWDFSSLLGRLTGSPWFVAMAVLAVTCEVYRRKVHKARQSLLFAGSDLTWFPKLTGSGSSEVS